MWLLELVRQLAVKLLEFVRKLGKLLEKLVKQLKYKELLVDEL